MIEALAQLDLPGWVAHYGLVSLRVLGLFVFLPIFGSEMLPGRVRMGVAALLSLVFLPIVPPLNPPPSGVVDWLIISVRELSAGLALGMAARMIFSGVEAAASLVAGQAGFAMGNMIDPTSGDQALAPALFQNLMFIALFLAADLHHVMIRAVVGSYELLPPALELPELGGLGQAASLLGLRLFTLGVELAAPALIVTVSVDLVMALVGKAMPQVPILFVAYPLKMAAGLVAIALLATTTGAALGWIGRTLATDGAALVAALGGR